MAMPQTALRTTFIAALVAAPALVAAIGLTAIEAYRVVRPEAELFGEQPPASLAEAITRRAGVEHAYAFIRGGQDPNGRIVVDDSEYTAGRSIPVSPLMLAVAARDSNVVAMLLNFGARLDLPQNRLAGCLARELGDEAVVSIITRAGGTVSTCQERGADAPTPLLAWIN